MRIILSAAIAAVVLLSGCASRGPSAGDAPPPPPVAVGKSNRFEMTQNGRRMSADDFDRWMKARGIRIAKGAPAARGKSSATSSKTPPRAQAKAQAKAPAKTPPKRR